MSANEKLIAEIDDALNRDECPTQDYQLLCDCRAALSLPAPQGAVEALRRFYDDFWAHAELDQEYWSVPQNEIEIADEMVKSYDRAALSAAPAEGETDGWSLADLKRNTDPPAAPSQGEPNFDADLGRVYPSPQTPADPIVYGLRRLGAAYPSVEGREYALPAADLIERQQTRIAELERAAAMRAERGKA